MSKKLTIAELNQLITDAINSIKNLFSKLLNRKTDKDNKKASLIAYWVKDYSKYISQEESFDSKSLLNYKRGDVLLIEFGFRIGSELGGRHFAVVIENKNSLYSDTITVVPLSSLKSNYSINRYTFILRKGLYNLYKKRMTERIDALGKEITSLNDYSNNLVESFSTKKISLDDFKKSQNIIQKKQKDIQTQIAILNKHIVELEKLKFGTVMNVGQITTVSKMRIVNPKNKRDSLFKVHLDTDDLDKLNEVLKDLYLFKNNS